MKNIVLYTIGILLSIGISKAQNDTMYIMNKVNVIGKYKITEIDSVVFNKPLYDTLFIMNKVDVTGKFKITDIDSAIFYKPVDMSIGYILNSSKVNTGFTLYSPDKNGEYFGFTGIPAWHNWYFLEGNDAGWGNLPLDGNSFTLSNASDAWNLWYPGVSGCYYTTLSIKNKEWTATNIPSLAVSGDVTATMTFDKVNVKWYVFLKTTADNAKVKVSCDVAKLYNKTTGTLDASAITKSLGFIANTDSTLSIDWNSASANDITISKAGEYTLTFYLVNPKTWTYEIKTGSTAIKPISNKLYLPGVGDGTGSWSFKDYLTLNSETDSTFSGVININSPWGYMMALDSGEWNDVYKMGSAEGFLAFKGATNITAPAAGLYLVQADLKNLTYSHTALGSQIYIAGLNDVWDFTSVILTQTTAGVYTGAASLTNASTWGIKIYILKDNWDSFYGGSLSSLKYLGSNIQEPTILAYGTYAITVDLINSTCSFVLQ